MLDRTRPVTLDQTLPASDQLYYRTLRLLIHTGHVRCGDRTRPVAEFVAKYRTCPVIIPDASGHSVTSATNSFSTQSPSPLLKCANHQVYHLVHMC